MASVRSFGNNPVLSIPYDIAQVIIISIYLRVLVLYSYSIVFILLAYSYRYDYSYSASILRAALRVRPPAVRKQSRTVLYRILYSAA